MCQIVVIQRDCNGLHGGFQFVLGQVTLPLMSKKSDIHCCMPLWMFSQRNNPYCVYPSKRCAKIQLFFEFSKYLTEKFANMPIFL